jgi:hypothetical protein
VKITLLSLNHELQWKDPTGDLHRILSELLATSTIDLIAEEAFGLPTTVAQRLACKLDKPWIQIDMSIAERKLAGIYDGLRARKHKIDPFGIVPGESEQYLPREDRIRETEWVERITAKPVETVLCLCGFLHVEPFADKLKAKGCDVEHLNLTEQEWFRKLYRTYKIAEESGERWCEIQ